MKRFSIILALFVMVSALLPAVSLAETTFDGTVVSSESISVTAPFGGIVSSFAVRQGDQIEQGDVIATVATTKVYAPAAGVVTGIFGQAGDAVEDVVTRVGAVLYIEPEQKYSITADIQYAYNDSDNKYVNIGETVYLYSYSSSYDHSAIGTITATNGTTYTVETTEGELLMGETVSVFRSSTYKAASRIGRGSVSRTAAIAVSGSGSILTMHVQDGDTVERGQLLYETVTGTLDGLYATSNEIVADVSGIVASVSTSSGSTVSKGDTLLTVYPRENMQVQIEVDEYDLTEIQEGDQLQLEFNYDDEENVTVVGTVAMISHVSATTDSSDATYYAYIDFTPNQNIRLGMTVVVNRTTTTATNAQTTTQEVAETDAAPTTDSDGMNGAAAEDGTSTAPVQEEQPAVGE